MKEYKISEGLKSFKYGCSRLDELLSNDDNIGIAGENLTIVILSCNRSKATIKLLNSISEHLKDFEGKILIADNASNKVELNNLKKYMNKSKLNVSIVEFEKNYGVAAGRNKILDYVETEWIMNLDNDIYFIKDPIQMIQKTISQLGVKFLNMPLLSEDGKTIFANGGTLYVSYDNNYKSVGGGSMFSQTKAEFEDFSPSLSTFVFGGASVIHKPTFIECGKFDDNMFIGFEDIDFSITLFNKGMKIGNCPILALVHDHTINIDENSIEYEKIRFNQGILKKSAAYLEKKWNCKVWDVNMEMWLEQRQKDLGILPKQKNASSEIHKPKIALIVDVENWCFWNIATEIKQNLSENYEFEIIPFDDININIVQLFFYLRNKQFDLVHFFWRSHLSKLNYSNEYLYSCGMDFDWFKQIYMDNISITTAVYDHLYLDNISFTNDILKYCDNYSVSSKKLLQIYESTSEIVKNPQMEISDGVDLNLFKPINIGRLNNQKNLTIGWVGNSAWSAEIEDFKGFNTILKPIIDELIKEGYPIKTLYADRQVRMIEHKDMPEYYSKIDLCICVSKVEGTPNPVLEAMACGVPIITTDVGIVKEVFGPKQRNFILKKRSKEELKKKIIEIIDNKFVLKELSKENLKYIKKWDWKIIGKNFKKFFDENLRSCNEK